jgi:hypothetical protein
MRMWFLLEFAVAATPRAGGRQAIDGRVLVFH